MSDSNNTFLQNLSVLATPDGFQKYILGTKSNGNPRAVYDIVRDYTKPKKKKKKSHKKNKGNGNAYSFYINSKKKKKKKGKKHWHI